MREMYAFGFMILLSPYCAIDDLKILTKEEQKRREKELEERIIQKIQKETVYKENRRKEVIYTGRILHLDGDKKYSEKSMMYYKKIFFFFAF